MLLYACYNKRVSKCEITFCPYSLATLKHEVLRLKESEDEQLLCRVVYIPTSYINMKYEKIL